nr:aldo/keto reductase [Mycobacterium sp. E1715]
MAAVNLRVFESDGPDQLFDDQLSVMIEARDAGLIGGIGLSNVNRDHLLRALERTEVACVQNAFNLVDRGQLVGAERAQVGLDVAAQVGRLVDR